MFVGKRHDETGQPVLRQLGLQRREAILDGGHGVFSL
jgi:hypothetical protein